MIYTNLPDFQVGFKFDWYSHVSTHTYKSGRKEQRLTETCFAKLYRIDGDREIPLVTGFHVRRPFMESVSNDRMRCKALLNAMQAAKLSRTERVRIWMAYAKAAVTIKLKDGTTLTHKMFRTHVPEEIPEVAPVKKVA